MAKQFFKDLPDTSTPLRASRLNGLLDGEEALGNLVVDSIKSKNINSKTLVQGLYQVSDGTPNYGYANYVTLDGFLPINYGDTITISNKNNVSGTYFVLEYDSNMQYLNQNQNAAGTTATFTIVNPNTKYIAIDLGSSGATPQTIGNFQVELGETATNYAPYQELNGLSNPISLLDYTSITQGTEYTLNDDIRKYKYLIVQLSTASNEANSSKQYIPVSLITAYDNTRRVAISLFQSTTVYIFGDFYFSASNKIRCNTYTHQSWNAQLKVWGIK